MNNSLTLRDNLAPRSFDQLTQFAEIISRTAMAPQAYRGKPEEIVATVIYGADLGFTPMQALQNIAVVNGKPSVYGDGLRALILGRTDCEGVEDGYDGSGDDYHAWVTVRRKGKAPVTRRFSVRDAKQAGLDGKHGPWKQYRDRMLLMRAQGFAIRDAYADALRGVISYEEAADYPSGPDNARDVTPRSDTWQHPATTLEPAPVDEWVFLFDRYGEEYSVTPVEAEAKWAGLVAECASEEELNDLARANQLAKQGSAWEPMKRLWKARREEIRTAPAEAPVQEQVLADYDTPKPWPVDAVVEAIAAATDKQEVDRIMREDRGVKALLADLTRGGAIKLQGVLAGHYGQAEAGSALKAFVDAAKQEAL